MLHEVGVRVEQGIPFDGGVRYAEAGAILRGFVPLVGPLVLAGRLVANFQFGDVPFYDLFQAGPFDQKEMPGGSAGIRGVPVGRYLGPIKVIGNIELRAMFFEFTVLKQKFSIGNDVFFDTGRVWSNYSFNSPLDGSGIGLKYGVGGGIYVSGGRPRCCGSKRPIRPMPSPRTRACRSASTSKTERCSESHESVWWSEVNSQVAHADESGADARPRVRVESLVLRGDGLPRLQGEGRTLQEEDFGVRVDAHRDEFRDVVVESQR